MYNNLLQQIKTLIEAGRNYAVRQVNSAMTMTYFLIGKYIVEDEQGGETRADYAAKTVKFLSKELTRTYGAGFSKRNLEYMRKFYLAFQNKLDFDNMEIVQTLSAQSENWKSETVSQKFTLPQNSKFTLSWSHYILLSRIENPDERSFYEIEATKGNWSLRELQRQYNSSLYERLALSRDKDQVARLARDGQILTNPLDVFKDPYVLEFLNLKEESSYSESDLETAILNQIERFMLELGKGFLFAGRRVRLSFSEKHYRLDLLLYTAYCGVL